MKHYDKCGDCVLFMTQQCPREPGDRIKKQWNSVGSFKCEKFMRSQYSVDLEASNIEKEKAEAIAEIKRRREEETLLVDLFKSFFY